MRINTSHQASVSEKLNKGVLQSLQFKFRADEPVYPLKISSLNKGTTDILLYVFAAHRVEEPLMKTECSIDSNLFQMWNLLENMLQVDPDIQASRLTKLTAKLTPNQMTHDLILKRSKTDDIVPVKNISPPFLKNLGATSLLLINTSLIYPNCVAVMGLAALVALSPLGRRRWRVWIASGIVFIIASIIMGDRWNQPQFIFDISREKNFLPAGIISISLIGIITTSIIISTIKRIRKTK